jgi:gliding motility-associated-like protein
VKYTATDGAGNTAICTFNVTVTDTTNPVITGCPSDISVSANSSCGAVATWAPPSASDNCTVTMSTTHTPGSTFPVGTTQVKYTATDTGGNTAVCTFNVIVTDNTSPVITGCPSNITASATASCGAMVTWTPPQATDNCSVTITGTHTSGSTFPVGTTQVKYTATDGSGNTAVCTFNVTVTDNSNPVITACPSNITVSATSSCTAVATWTPPLATDNCPVLLTTTHSPGSSFALGTTQVKYTATDGAGNTAICTFNVTVTDNTNPVITGCPSNITVSANSSCGAIVTWAAPSASDNCFVTMTSTHSPGSSFAIGTTQVKYTATDGAGNTAVCSFNVVVTDQTAPTFTNCPSDVIVNSNSSCSALATWNPPVVSDNCSATLTRTHSPGDSFPIGVTEVKYAATDAAGNTSFCIFKVTVNDELAPQITGVPIDIVVSASSCGTQVSWTEPVVSDNCSFTVTSSHHSGDTFPIGITEVVYTASDAAGHVSTAKFNVHVLDSSNPQFTSVPGDISITTSSSCKIPVNWSEVIVTDNCSATLSSTHQPGSEFPIGVTQVTYTATDLAGNTATYSFKVTVSGGAPPVISNCPADITIAAESTCKKTVSWSPPVISSSCGNATLTSSHQPGVEFPLGTTQVTYTATDAHGNSSTCIFNVSVVDSAPPAITSCPSSPISAIANENGVATVSWTLPSATDCSAITSTSNHNPGDIFPIGETDVTYTFKDASLNQSTCQFKVIVEDKTAPVFQACPGDVTVTVENVCSAVVTWTPPIISDNSSVVGTTSTHNPGDDFPIGTTEVEISATDGYGNIGYCRFKVNVISSTVPAFQACPSTIQIFAELSGNAIATWDEPIFPDPCNAYTVSKSHDPNTTFSLGSTVVTYTAKNIYDGTAVNCSFEVNIIERPIVFDLPKFFTPDGDGVNDKWILKDIENFENAYVLVVDRWGGVVYESSGYNNENVVWDGSNGHKPVPTGTYFYTIRVRHMSNNFETRGFLEVVR